MGSWSSAICHEIIVVSGRTLPPHFRLRRCIVLTLPSIDNQYERIKPYPCERSGQAPGSIMVGQTLLIASALPVVLEWFCRGQRWGGVLQYAPTPYICNVLKALITFSKPNNYLDHLVRFMFIVLTASGNRHERENRQHWYWNQLTLFLGCFCKERDYYVHQT